MQHKCVLPASWSVSDIADDVLINLGIRLIVSTTLLSKEKKKKSGYESLTFKVKCVWTLQGTMEIKSEVT